MSEIVTSTQLYIAARAMKMIEDWIETMPARDQPALRASIHRALPGIIASARHLALLVDMPPDATGH